MNLSTRIEHHESKAAFYARLGKAKASRLHKLRAEQLRVAKKIRRELRR